MPVTYTIVHLLRTDGVDKPCAEYGPMSRGEALDRLDGMIGDLPHWQREPSPRSGEVALSHPDVPHLSVYRLQMKGI